MLKANEWNTYHTAGYTFDAANDRPSQGGVHHHQVRRTKDNFQHRIVQSNGRHFAFGPTSVMSEEDGQRAFQKAQIAARLPDHG